MTHTASTRARRAPLRDRVRAAVDRWCDRGVSAAVVVGAPLALRVLPLRATLALCDRMPRRRAPGLSYAAINDRVGRWLARGRGAWRSTCLTRAVARYALLRRHGHDATLHVGVRGRAADFEAHAWLSLGNGARVEHPDAADGGLAGYDIVLTHHA